MRFKNLLNKIIIVGILFALITCLYACSNNENTVVESFSSSTSTTRADKTTKIVLTTKENVATEGVCGDTAIWSFDEKSKTMTIKGTGEIKNNWKTWNHLIEKVVIEEGITGIDYNTFYNCISLNEIAIPDSVRNIYSGAFEKSGLYNNSSNWIDGILYIDNHVVDAEENISGDIKIKDGARSIASLAFMQCEKITSITIPDSVKSIGTSSFGQCVNLEKVSIGKGVELISDSLFDDPYAGCGIVVCSSLKEISVDSENPYFADENGILFNKEKTELIKLPTLCSQKSFVLPDSVTLIRPTAFHYCTTLENLIINSYNITSLEGVYFAGCKNLETVVLPYSLIDLGDQTFKFSGIRSIVIPDRVSRIGQETFAYCDNLKTITLGSGISEIDGSAFAASYALEHINVASGNSNYSSEEGVLFNKDKTELIIYPYAKNSEQYNIPESVKNIAGGAFDCSKNLKKLFVGKNVERIASGNTFHGKIVDADYGLGDPREYYTYDIYYEGSQSQWAQINSLNENFDEIESTVHFNSSRPLETTAPTKKTNLFDWFWLKSYRTHSEYTFVSGVCSCLLGKTDITAKILPCIMI